MAKISTFFNGTPKKTENHPNRNTIWLHYKKLRRNPAQYRYGRTPKERQALEAENRRKEEALADLIEADGEVLQDLLVRKIDTDEYEIISGDHRRGACKILVEERGEEKYALLPCQIKTISDVKSEFMVYSSNGYAQKTDYEIMCEVEGMKRLLETYPEEFPEVSGGRMVERLARVLDMKKSTVGEYLTISKNLGKKGMEKYQKKELGKSAAVALAGLPEEEQENLIEQGITTHRDIKKFKQRQIDPEVKDTSAKQTESIVMAQQEKTSSNMNPLEKAEEFPDQPLLPLLKNSDQRKEWLRNYKAWGVWYTDDNIGCTYYKYDFENGARLIAETYQIPESKWKKEHEAYYLHLVGGPIPPINGLWERHEVYEKQPDCETELIEFLKFVQK